MIDMQWGDLTVIKRRGIDGSGYILWECLCSCGNTTLRSSRNLKRFNHPTCGHDKDPTNIIGETFGKWEILDYVHTDNNGERYYNCKCDCGTERDVKVSSLKNGKSVGCGCDRIQKIKGYVPKLIGVKFGRWTVLGINGDKHNRRGTWHNCICECGNVGVVRSDQLKNGDSKSCGCLMREVSAKTGRSRGRGLTPKNHLIRTSAKYMEWRNMVFQRDNYECQVCGDVGGSLVAHHIFPFATYENLRTNTNNGITLCKEHHKDFHQKYSNMYFTKENLVEYLINYLTVRG